MPDRLIVRSLLAGLGHLLAPRVCRVCGCTLAAAEEHLCLGCLIDLPRTGAHASDFNIIHRRLGHNCHVDRAAGWFFYRRGTAYARLLVDAKYGALPRLARSLGRQCAVELQADAFFDGIDLLAPMPMHWRKRLARGYNQAEEICHGIVDATGIAVCAGALRASKSHAIQSRQSAAARHANIAGTITPGRGASALGGRHVLLVDDIITTGATAAEAIRALSAASPAAISILALGLTASD